MDPLDMLQIIRDGKVQTLDTLKQPRPYRIIHIDRICINGSA